VEWLKVKAQYCKKKRERKNNRSWFIKQYSSQKYEGEE
jgi:hypothetical protein